MLWYDEVVVTSSFSGDFGVWPHHRSLALTFRNYLVRHCVPVCIHSINLFLHLASLPFLLACAFILLNLNRKKIPFCSAVFVSWTRYFLPYIVANAHSLHCNRWLCPGWGFARPFEERDRELLSTVVVIQLIYLLLQSTIEAIAVCFGGEAVLFVIVILVVVCNARRFFIIE